MAILCVDMNKGKFGIIIFGAIGCIIALLIFWLGLSMFMKEKDTYKTTYGFFGLTIKGKALAAMLILLGLVLLYYGIKKTIKYSKAV